jgi:16S rRNA (cytosine1402-N4)-methyltransferase
LILAQAALDIWGERVELVHSDFRDIDQILAGARADEVTGIVADLGLSSYQLETSERGFSFQREAPLDMRMDRGSGPTLRRMLDEVGEQELADIIFRYGEERYSRRIARAIVAAREDGRLDTTADLAGIVRGAIKRRGRPRLDPATRTFQALRIWTNSELDGLDEFLCKACGHLEPAGRLAVIAFHSLEDRVVKHTFRKVAADPSSGLQLVTRKPRTASASEVARNPRSRSAKLRVIERVPT